jgi:isoleucyl-tRNA synthetase
VQQVTEAYETYDVPGATRPVQAFVDTLSNWYVRLSRRRFWKSESDADKQGAYATLYECLTTVAQLMAPAAPFLSESLYRNLVADVFGNMPPSVHLSRWPQHDPALIDKALIDEMRLVERLVSLGRAARETVKLGIRQPLADAAFVVRDPAEVAALGRMSSLIAAELNVKNVRLLDEPTYTLNPLPQVLGRKFGKNFPRVQKHLREGAQEDVQRWAKTLLAGETVSVTLDGETYEVNGEEVQVLMKAAEGFASAEEGGYMAVIDTRLNDDLINEGLAREVVRRVQSMRRDADFNISDKIVTRYVASDRLASAISQFADYIQAETLTQTLEASEPEDGFHREAFTLDQETLSLGVKRVEA